MIVSFFLGHRNLYSPRVERLTLDFLLVILFLIFNLFLNQIITYIRYYRDNFKLILNINIYKQYYKRAVVKFSEITNSILTINKNIL